MKVAAVLLIVAALGAPPAVHPDVASIVEGIAAAGTLIALVAGFFRFRKDVTIRATDAAVNSLQAALDRHEKELEHALDRIRALESDLAGANQRIAALEGQLAASDGHNEQLQDRLAAEVQRRTRVEQELEQARAQRDEMVRQRGGQPGGRRVGDRPPDEPD